MSLLEGIGWVKVCMGWLLENFKIFVNKFRGIVILEGIKVEGRVFILFCGRNLNMFVSRGVEYKREGD